MGGFGAMIALAELFVGASVCAETSSAGARERFAGTYTYAGGKPQIAARDAAIERATDGLFFAIRGIARGKLRDKTEIKPTIGFVFDRGAITSSATGVASVTSREDGTATRRVIGDDTLQIAQKLTPEGHLVQTFAASEGTRTNDYVLGDDGRTLFVSVSVTSAKLTRPLRYQLVYARR